MESKACSRCGVVKSLAEFGPDKSKRDGVQSRCRPCKNDAQRARMHEYRQEKKELHNARNRRWRANNPDRVKELQAGYRATRPEAYREYDRKHYQANRDVLLIKMQEYRKANVEKLRKIRNDSCARRRARILGLPHEAVKLDVLIERDNGRCQICGKAQGREKWSIDHILPISRGGGNTYLNTRLAHLSCNMKRRHLGAAQLRMV